MERYFRSQEPELPGSLQENEREISQLQYVGDWENEGEILMKALFCYVIISLWLFNKKYSKGLNFHLIILYNTLLFV